MAQEVLQHRRSRKLRNAFTVLLALVLTILIAAGVFFKSGLPAYQLSKYVNDNFLADTDYRFSCGDISGNMVGRISLGRPVLRYNGPDGVFEVFSANRLTIDYSLMHVLKLQMLVSNLEIESPSVVLKQDPTGRFMLPIPESKAPEDTPAEFEPLIEIERFNITDMDFVLEEKTLDIAGRDIDAQGRFRLIGSDGSFEVQRAVGELTKPDLPLEMFSVEAEHSNFNDFKIRNATLRLANSFVVASGRARIVDEGLRLHQSQFVFNPIDLKELEAFDIGVNNVDGELGGNLLADGIVIDSLRVSGTATGKALGYALSGMRFRGGVGPDDVVFESIEGGFFGARVNGEFRYGRHTGSFGFDGVCEGLDLSEGIVQDSELPVSDLNGLVSIEHDSDTGVYEITGDLRRSMFMDFRMDEANARLRWHDVDGLRIRSLRASGAGYQLQGSGTLSADMNADIIVALQGDSLDYIADYLTLPRVGGTVDLSGRIVGPLDNLQVNLNGTSLGLQYLTGTIDSCQVQAQAAGIGSEFVTAAVAVSGDALDISGRSFSNPHVFVETEGEQVTVRDLSFSRGDTLVTMDFGVEQSGSKTIVDLRHVVVQTPEDLWQLHKPTDVVVDTHQTVLDSIVLRSNGHRLGVTGTYAKDFERVNLRAWGDNLELSILREALRLPFRVEGVGSFRSTIVGAFEEPRIELSVDIAKGAVDSLTFDRFIFDGGYDAHGYRVDRLFVQDRGDSITGSGRWSFTDSPVEMSRDGLRREAAFAAPLSVRFDSHRYPVRAAMEAAHVDPFWSGSFTGTMTVEGTLADPVMRWSGEVVARPDERYQLPDIATELSYDEGLLTIGNIAFDDGKTSLKITGRVPMDLGADTGAKLREAENVHIDAQLISKDLSTVAPYFDEIATAGGELSSRLLIAGTAGDPTYQGSLTLRNGALRVAGMKENYREVEADVVLDQRLLKLTKLEGKADKKGNFNGQGELRFKGFRPDSYQLDVALNDMRIESIEDIVATASGDIKVESARRQDGRLIPHGTGELKVKEAWINKTFAAAEGPPTGPSRPTDNPEWTCSIDLDAPKNIWVKNPDLSMELGGRTVLVRDTRGLYFLGELEVLRGSYSLYNNKFRITQGRFDFSRGTTLRPEVFLEAYTPHRVPGQEERRIFLTLDWPTDKKEPELHLSYDVPGYSEPDLWRMLGGQVIAGEGAVTESGQWDAGGTATNVAANYLERVLNTRMANMTIDIETRLADGSGGTTADRELSIAVGRYLSEDLYLKYRQGLSFASDRQVDIEYRISNLVLLRSEIIQYSSRRGLAGKDRPTTDEINFDIKFRWEY